MITTRSGTMLVTDRKPERTRHRSGCCAESPWKTPAGGTRSVQHVARTKRLSFHRLFLAEHSMEVKT